jgi:Zn-finger nucleic acid-binding protein
MGILQTLANADDTLVFSDLYDRIGDIDSGNFTYHLDKLVGHFVESTDEGYQLRRAGERIIEAVVSGAVTEKPVIEPTQIDWPCSQCGTSIFMSYLPGWVVASCPGCSGVYGADATDDRIPEEQRDHGYLGRASFPPAAIQNRDLLDVLQASLAWDFLERIAISNGICPRCSAVVDRRLTACEDHEAGEELCEECGHRHQELFTAECQTCPMKSVGILPTAVHGYPVVMEFETSHGFNPVVPTREQWVAMGDAWNVEVPSLDPLRARVTYSIDGDVLELTVDEQLDVVDVTEHR